MQLLQLDDYHISIGPVAESLTAFLEGKNYSQLNVLVDENTERDCLPLIEDVLSGYKWSVIKIASGELHKNINTCQFIWQKMMENRADRKSLSIHLGGGVIGDMGGFCASTFKRGMDFIQIPTTLLSQVDASIGGKLGIDFMQLKNSIGLFQNPKVVLIDPAFLETLPKAEIKSGFAEIIKHSLIADVVEWDKIRQLESLEGLSWPEILIPSLKIKQRVVKADPFEKNIRKSLNFGHTAGHAVESVALESEKPLLHGEAVAIGMICEAWLSHKVLDLPLPEVKKIARLVFNIYDLPKLKAKDFPSYLKLMENDKKNETGKINFSMINPAGTCVINQYCDDKLILESLTFYNNVLESGA